MSESPKLLAPPSPERIKDTFTGAEHAPRILTDASRHQQRPAGDFIGLEDIFSRLWRSRWTLAMGAMLGIAGAVGLSLLIKPVYRAQTSIRLEPLNERFPNLPELLSTEPAGASEVYLQNELKVLESDSLARRVAMKLGLQPVRDDGAASRVRFAGFTLPAVQFSRPLSADDQLIRQVERALTTRPSLKSQVIDIAFDAGDPQFAARGANAVVAEYIAMNREARMETTRDNTEWMTQQISDLKNALDRGNAHLQAFAKSSGLLYGANQSLLSEEKARQLQEELSRAEADRASKEANYQAAISNSLEALPANADSGLLREYQSKLGAAQTELVQLRGLYTPAHYKVADAQARVAQLEASVKAEQQRIVARMRSEFDAARRLEDSLAGSYGAGTRKLSEQTVAAIRYNEIKRDLDSTELLYNSLMQKAREAGVTSAMSAINVRIIDAARPPSTPRSPNMPLNSSMGLATGLLFTAGFVLIRNRDAYPDGQAIEWHELGIRGLGAVPNVRRFGSQRRSFGLVNRGPQNAGVELDAWYEQPSDLTEAFRSAITSIIFAPKLDRKKKMVLTVTSIQPREGKTTTVSNLGIALAETHGRVLLIDADLRRPRIHEIFGFCNDSGLSTLLTGEEPISTVPLDTLIRKTNVPGLSALPSGPGAASVPPLLYSERMQSLLERLRGEYDYILIDTPPTSLFSDARVLGRQSDGLVLVVHAARVTRSELTDTCRNLLKDGTRVVGTILNRCNSRVRGYEGYRYTAV